MEWDIYFDQIAELYTNWKNLFMVHLDGSGEEDFRIPYLDIILKSGFEFVPNSNKFFKVLDFNLNFFIETQP